MQKILNTLGIASKTNFRPPPDVLTNYINTIFSTQDGVSNISGSILHRINSNNPKPADYAQNPLHICDSWAPCEENIGLSPAGTFLSLKELGYSDFIWVDKIGDENWNKALRELWKANIIGFDSEFPLKHTSFDKETVSLFQIATQSVVIIFDVLKLKNEEFFYQVMRKIFENPDVLKLGHRGY